MWLSFRDIQHQSCRLADRQTVTVTDNINGSLKLIAAARANRMMELPDAEEFRRYRPCSAVLTDRLQHRSSVHRIMSDRRTERRTRQTSCVSKVCVCAAWSGKNVL